MSETATQVETAWVEATRKSSQPAASQPRLSVIEREAGIEWEIVKEIVKQMPSVAAIETESPLVTALTVDSFRS